MASSPLYRAQEGMEPNVCRFSGGGRRNSKGSPEIRNRCAAASNAEPAIALEIEREEPRRWGLAHVSGRRALAVRKKADFVPTTPGALP